MSVGVVRPGGGVTAQVRVVEAFGGCIRWELGDVVCGTGGGEAEAPPAPSLAALLQYKCVICIELSINFLI